jgi:hypothetical protein
VALWAVGVQIPPPTPNYLQERKKPPETDRPPGALIAPKLAPRAGTARNMFGIKKRGPTRSFTHVDNCKILKADPGVEIKWSEVETGHWRAVCQCGSEDVQEEPADRRVRLDPLDAKTSRHLGQCEYVSETDPAVLKVLLKIKDGAGGSYWWVECGACDTGWQVPYYVESVG